VTVPLLADENFDGDIVQGLRQRVPSIDLVRVQDIGLTGAVDPVVLEWAAQKGRVLLTHDIKTMPGHAYRRVRDGLVMAGVIETPRSLPVGSAVQALARLLETGDRLDFEDRVLFLPRR
jgi:hypothetical protein